MKRSTVKIKNNILGTYLKEQRLKRALSQSDLASALKYESPQYISDWERGVSAPPLKKLFPLSRILHVKADVIFQLLLKSSLQKLEDDLCSEYSRMRRKLH